MGMPPKGAAGALTKAEIGKAEPVLPQGSQRLQSFNHEKRE
jgi:hypothetical protein